MSFTDIDTQMLGEIFDFRKRQFLQRSAEGKKKKNKGKPTDLTSVFDSLKANERHTEALQHGAVGTETETTLGQRVSERNKYTLADFGYLTAEEIAGLARDKNPDYSRLLKAYNKLVVSTGFKSDTAKSEGDNIKTLVNILWHYGRTTEDLGMNPPSDRAGAPNKALFTNRDKRKWMIAYGGFNIPDYMVHIRKVMTELSQMASDLHAENDGRNTIIDEKIVRQKTSKGKEPAGSSSAPTGTEIIAVDTSKQRPPPQIEGEYNRVSALNGNSPNDRELLTSIEETLEQDQISQAERRLMYEHVQRLRKKRPPIMTKTEFDKLITAIDYQQLVGSGIKSDESLALAMRDILHKGSKITENERLMVYRHAINLKNRRPPAISEAQFKKIMKGIGVTVKKMKKTKPKK